MLDAYQRGQWWELDPDGWRKAAEYWEKRLALVLPGPHGSRADWQGSGTLLTAAGRLFVLTARHVVWPEGREPECASSLRLAFCDGALPVSGLVETVVFPPADNKADVALLVLAEHALPGLRHLNPMTLLDMADLADIERQPTDWLLVVGTPSRLNDEVEGEFQRFNAMLYDAPLRAECPNHVDERGVLEEGIHLEWASVVDCQTGESREAFPTGGISGAPVWWWPRPGTHLADTTSGRLVGVVKGRSEEDACLLATPLSAFAEWLLDAVCRFR